MTNAMWSSIGALLTAWSSWAFAAGEVKLVEVTSTVSRSHGLSQQGLTFEAAVKNLAPNKQVFAHYRAADGTWVDAPLSFNRAGDGQNEVWSATFTQPVGVTFDVQFALRYEVNGQTYWDNNNGNNYFIAKDSGIQLAPDVNVAALSHVPSRILRPGDTELNGSVALRNLAVAKDVTVHYSTDNWATARVASATYTPFFWQGSGSNASNPNEYGVEGWTYTLDVGNASQVQYAIRYVVNGQTFWDNNFGQNFRTALIRR